MTDPGFLTVKDVARRYAVHPETVRRWIKEGLAATKLGNRAGWRVREADLDRFLADRAVGAPSDPKEDER